MACMARYFRRYSDEINCNWHKVHYPDYLVQTGMPLQTGMIIFRSLDTFRSIDDLSGKNGFSGLCHFSVKNYFFRKDRQYTEK